MAKRYMDFTPRKSGAAAKGTAPGVVAEVPTTATEKASGVRMRVRAARPEPEITIPEPRPVENEVPIRLMPNQKVVQRKVVRRTTTGVRAVPPTEVSRGVTEGISRVRAVPRKRVISGVGTGNVSKVNSSVGGATPRAAARVGARTAAGVARPQRTATTGATRMTKAGTTRKVEMGVPTETLGTPKVVKTKVAKDTTETATPVIKNATEVAKQTAKKPTGVAERLRSRVAKNPLQQRATGLMRKRRLEMSEVPTAETMVDDPLERPMSEFADLEELAQEIEEVTRGGVIDEETEFVSATESFSLKQQPQFGVVEDFQPRFLDTEVEKRPLSGGPARSAGLTGVASVATEAEVTTEVTETEMMGFETALGEENVDVSTNLASGMGSKMIREADSARNAGVNSAAMRTLAAKKAKMQIPNAKFINQNKVAKRPLSKTAYTVAGYGTVAGTTTGVAVGAKMASAGTGVKLAAPGSKLKSKEKKEIAVAKDNKKGGAFGMVIAIILTVILGAVVGTVAFLILPR